MVLEIYNINHKKTHKMRNIFLLILLIAATIANAQLKPTLEEALVNVLVTNLKDVPTEGDKVLFTSKTTKKVFSGISGADGKFEILLPLGDTYDIQLKSFEIDIDYAAMEIPQFEGYFTQNVHVKYELPKTYTLENIYFDTGKATLKPESTGTLENMSELMLNKKTMIIEISGHTDNVGKDDYNMKLSQDRANAVKDYLVSKGVESERVKTVGFGPTMPIASNDTEEGRQKNRRISVKIVSE